MLRRAVGRLLGRVRVPRDLGAVTEVAAEADRLGVLGMTTAGRDAIWRAVQDLYRTGTHPGIALCLRRRGQVVIDRAIGHARGRSPHARSKPHEVRMTPRTPVCLFSASKANTAMLVHLLAQRGRLSLDDRIADYLPEFARHGKASITLRHLLTHRAGLPSVPGSLDDPELLLDPDRALAALCDARPRGVPGGPPAYHALSSGYIVAAVVERATGRDLRRVMHDEVLGPLGFELVNYGIAAERREEVAENVATGLPPPPGVSVLTTRALGLTWHQATRLSMDERFFANIIPSANIVATANEASRFYQLLLNGGTLDGVRIFEPATIAAARTESTESEIDRILLMPVRHGVGLMLGADYLSPYGPGTPDAFGHVGFMPLLCWADPQREIAVALLTTGKLLADTHLIGTYRVLRAIARHCPARW
jgi:CubicO group peptidase (beta-lactamase class C family)